MLLRLGLTCFASLLVLWNPLRVLLVFLFGLLAVSFAQLTMVCVSCTLLVNCSRIQSCLLGLLTIKGVKQRGAFGVVVRPLDVALTGIVVLDVARTLARVLEDNMFVPL